jgi:hypothetical protein
MGTIIIHPGAIKKYLELSWDFAYQKLLHRYLLNDHEIDAYKLLIGKLYESISPEDFRIKANTYFIEYCDRIDDFIIGRDCTRVSMFSFMENVIMEISNAKPDGSNSSADKMGSIKTNCVLSAD